MHEFDLIARYFRPLAAGFSGALGLADDAALLSIPPGQELVITKDAIVQGVHYLGDEDPALIAKKLLRVNLSDLAAKGARPLCYFLALAFPKTTQEAFIARFAEGLAEDQREFGMHLSGGDTVSTTGPAVFSLTALGTIPSGSMLTRAGAKAGDGIYVSGTLGDSALGLKILRHPDPLSLRHPERSEGSFSRSDHKIVRCAQDDEYLKERYFLPQPRLALGQALRGIAGACMDISDGLVQDAGHLARASNCKAAIDAKRLPISEAALRAMAANPQWGMDVLTGGDDYELLFTVSPENEPKLSAFGKGITRIGTMQPGSGVEIRDDNGQPMTFKKTGWRHF